MCTLNAEVWWTDCSTDRQAAQERQEAAQALHEAEMAKMRAEVQTLKKTSTTSTNDAENTNEAFDLSATRRPEEIARASGLYSPRLGNDAPFNRTFGLCGGHPHASVLT